MNTIVIYSSKTGYTKRYVDWICDDTGAICKEIGNVKSQELNSYDTIIFGGGLYAAGINGLKKFKKLINDIEGKRVIIFTTGVSPGRDEDIKHILEKNLTEDELENIEFYYLRGGFNKKALNFTDRCLMGLLKKKILSKAPEDRTIDDLGMLAIYDKVTDYTNKDLLKPLLDTLSQHSDA